MLFAQEATGTALDGLVVGCPAASTPVRAPAIPARLVRELAGRVRVAARALVAAFTRTTTGVAGRAGWELRVLKQLAVREVRLQYRGTALGLAWAVASPLAMAAVYVGLFRGVMAVGGAGYPRELLAGLVPWTGFAAALCAAAHAPLTHGSLLRGHRVPVRLLVAAAAAAALPGLVAGLTLLTAWSATSAISAMSGMPAIPATSGCTAVSAALLPFAGPLRALAPLLALPLLVLIQLALAIAIGLPLALANTLVRDTQHALHYVLRLAFFLTPIVWLPEQLPPRLAPFKAWIAANPLAGLAAAYREVLVHGAFPDPATLIPAALWALLFLTAGLIAERRLGRRIAELL